MLTIDASTGAVRWSRCCLHPTMTEDDLLQVDSEPVRLGGAHIANDIVYTHYTIHRVPVNGGSTIVTVYFENRGLTQVTLHFWLAGDTSDWSGWSAEQERRRQRVHDAFLETLLGEAQGEESLATTALEENPFTHRWYAFPWGKVGSTYDEKAGFAEIYIRYT